MEIRLRQQILQHFDVDGAHDQLIYSWLYCNMYVRKTYSRPENKFIKRPRKD